MLGLALEGGGAKGAFHLGAVKALLEEGYHFDAVAGTSIGALNGAIIAQGDFEIGYKLWENIDPTLLFDIEEAQYHKLISKQIDKEVLTHIFSKAKNVIGNKGIDTSKMRKVIGNVIDEEKLRNSSIDFGLVTVSITDKKPLELYKEDIPQGQIIDYLMASANLPVFKSTPIEDKYFLDGGFYDNCPINLLAKKGCDEVIAVRTLGPGLKQNLKYKNIKVTNIFPAEDLGRVLNFDNSLVHRNLKMGYFDAMRSIKGYKGRKYYIHPQKEELFFDAFLSIDEELINKWGNMLGIKDMNPRRMLLEKIIPSAADNLQMQSSSTYQDIIITMFETLAEERYIDKYKVYSFGEFVKEIKKLPSLKSESSKTLNSKIIMNTNIAGKFSKRIVLKDLAQQVFEIMAY